MTIPQNFKPLLAVDSDKVKNPKFPCLVSPKLNGIRCIVFGGVAYSRSLKPLPNKSIQAWAKAHQDVLEALDGEIIAGGNIYAPDALNLSTSLVMSQDKTGVFTFCVFDKYHTILPYSKRIQDVYNNDNLRLTENVKIIYHLTCCTQAEVNDYENTFKKQGAEGLMIRDPDGMYKHGRSGTKNPELTKVKRFVDGEFKIIGYEEKMHNANEATTNELGRTQRSTCKENLVPMGTLGALILETSAGVPFNCGTGFTDDMRDYLWSIRLTLPGQYAKIEYFPEGMQDVPLLPVFLQIRNPIDMSE
jgi:DNA ligase 1